MDLYSRKIIGCAYGRHMADGLAVEAGRNAYLNIKNTKHAVKKRRNESQYNRKRIHGSVGYRTPQKGDEECPKKLFVRN